MAEKRKRVTEVDSERSQMAPRKKAKRGFVVGPDNLPDGTYKRKTQKIKKALIERAQIKKDYAKLKRQGKVSDEREELPQPASAALDAREPDNNARADDEDALSEDSDRPVQARHPDRQTLIDTDDTTKPQHNGTPQDRSDRRKRKPKPLPFQREYEAAQRRKAEAEERRKAREEAERQRQAKIEERERFRKQMAKARTGGVNGQRKLGRESKVLLERVKRMLGEGG